MLLHLPSRLSFFVCFQVCLLNVVRWWWLLYGFFLFLRLLLNLISAISGPSLCHQNLCCTIPEAKAPGVGYTVFGRGTLFFSMILKGSACSHYFASVNSVCAEKKSQIRISLHGEIFRTPKPACRHIAHWAHMKSVYYFYLLVSSASCHLVADLEVGWTFLALSGEESFMSCSGFHWWRVFLK